VTADTACRACNDGLNDTVLSQAEDGNFACLNVERASLIVLGQNIHLKLNFDFGIDDAEQAHEPLKRKAIEFAMPNARYFRLANSGGGFERDGSAPFCSDGFHDLVCYQFPCVIDTRRPTLVDLSLRKLLGFWYSPRASAYLDRLALLFAHHQTPVFSSNKKEAATRDEDIPR
jgi:hypothetical protein